MPESRELFWDKPLDLPVANAVHITAGITQSTSYRATFVPGETGADGKVPGRITLTPVRAIPNYLQPVPIDASQPFSARWTPLAQALSSSRMYLDSHADDARSQSALAKVIRLDPMQHVEAEHEWLEELEWAVGRAPRSRIAQVAGTAEEAFVRHYGPTDSLAYVRNYDSMAFFQIGEVLAKFEVMNPAELVRASRTDQRVELVLEDGPGHGSANYFLVPMSAAFPAWMGTSSANVSDWVLFVLRTPRPGPLLDVWHRDKWRGWIGSWYKSGIWEPLDVPKPAEFVRWYIEHFNQTIQQLLDFNSTAALSGAIRPMSQLAMVRFFFHLHDLIGRLAMTSDPYARFMLSLTALDRFDALGWSYDTIANAGAMELAMKPLGTTRNSDPCSDHSPRGRGSVRCAG